jgi:hypothetical protein
MEAEAPLGHETALSVERDSAPPGRGLCIERSNHALRKRTRRCSQPEPAASPGNKPNVNGGWPRWLTSSLGERMSAKSTLLLLAVGTLLTACRHADVAPQPDGSLNPTGYLTGRPGTSADIGPVMFSPRTPAEVAADTEIVQHIVGTWVADPLTDTPDYQAITIRPDGTFTATTGQNRQVSGAWRVDRRVLFLGKPNASAPLDYYGFHAIEVADGHHLVCGTDISVAGRMRFRK